MQEKLDNIVDIILNKTIKENIPTVVFLSNIKETDIVKRLFSIKTQKEYKEEKFTPYDWSKLADTMLKLANIPLVIKQIDSVKNTFNKIYDFNAELKKSIGLVIIECGEYDFSKIENTKNIVVNII